MNTYRIPNLARACHVLKMFAASAEQLTSSDVARRLQMPRTTALRILHTLAAEGLLTRNGSAFAAGGELVKLGQRALRATRVRELAVPVLQALASATGETAHLAVLAGDQSLIVEVCDSPNPVRAASRPGTLAALHASATGKVFLAFVLRANGGDQPWPPVPLTARTPNTFTDPQALAAECDAVIRQGFAVDNEEYHPGVRCLAAPVMDAAGMVVAAVGITASAVSFPRGRVTQVARQVLSAAQSLSSALGHGAAAAAG